jgi:hypothetical protein
MMSIEEFSVIEQAVKANIAPAEIVAAFNELATLREQVKRFGQPESYYLKAITPLLPPVPSSTEKQIPISDTGPRRAGWRRASGPWTLSSIHPKNTDPLYMIPIHSHSPDDDPHMYSQ